MGAIQKLIQMCIQKEGYLFKSEMNKVYAAQAELSMLLESLQPCGHPLSAIVQADEGTAFCSTCADDSLRANIAAGVEL